MKTNEKDTKQGIVPVLRFPEFKNSAPWQTDTIDNLVSTITPPCKLNTSEYQKTGEYPIVDQSQDLYCGWTNNSSAIIFQQFPLIVFGDHTCAIKLITEPFAQGADGIKIIKSKERIDPCFLYQCLKYKPIIQENYKRHFALLKDKVIAYPLKKTGEQQKIAECLLSIDTLIKATENKIDELRAHKKGLMQQLFPAEGKTVPALRFPEFQDAGGWIETPIYRIGKIFNGLSGKNSSDFGYGKRYITYKQVYSDTVNDFDKCEKVFIGETEKQNFVIHGDILVTTSSEIPNEVGISSVILEPLSETIYLNSFCFILRPYDINKLYPKFAKHLFRSQIYRNRINKLAQGAIRFNLSRNQFANLRLPFPNNLKEQQKIADCLSSVDDLIMAQSNRLETLKVHKKGLMQQLFPNLNVHKE